MRAAVLDSSAIIRIFIPDGDIPDQLDEFIALAAANDAVLFAPELAIAEVGQVLLKKERSKFISVSESRGLLRAILRLPLRTIGHRGYLTRAQTLARTMKLTVYDGLFLALALQLRTPLITADSDLKRAAKRLGID